MTEDEQQKRILVVEDDHTARDTLVEVLEKSGYAVGSAANGAEALEMLRTGPRPNAILLDLAMPVMDGFEFRNQQKRDPKLASIPVVVITARARGDTPAIDADEYVSKPITLIKVLAALARHC